jgi:hypothetical protein
MMHKEQHKRPSTRDILTDPYMIEVITQFYIQKGYSNGSLFVQSTQEIDLKQSRQNNS